MYKYDLVVLSADFVGFLGDYCLYINRFWILINIFVNK